MSEYWKSTPKYWCKHCKTFIKDTKLEKTNHEATPKHQGNLQRFLRSLHHGHEREERDKQRAAAELDRLNGVARPRGGAEGLMGRSGAAQASALAQSHTASPMDRKKQLQQLANMGVAVPEDFRREVAMAGDWQTIGQRKIYDEAVKQEGIKDEGNADVKSGVLNIGVRKRRHEGQEEEEELEESVVKKGWGSTVRTYPGQCDEVDDLDKLLNQTTANGQIAVSTASDHTPSLTDTIKNVNNDNTGTVQSLHIKNEVPGPQQGVLSSTGTTADFPIIKTEQDGQNAPTVLFKKRKPKTTHNKDMP